MADTDAGNKPDGDGPAHGADHGRDGDAIRIMGVFFGLLGATVMIATDWARWQEADQALNIAAAVALMVVGVVFFISGHKLRNRTDAREHTEAS